MVYLVLLVVVGTSIWVALDARNFDWGGGTGSFGWTAGCLLLWLIFFPIYLYQRSKTPRKGALTPVSRIHYSSAPPPTGLPLSNGAATAPALPPPTPTFAPPVEDRVACPRCAELVMRNAQVCRFCEHELSPQVEISPAISAGRQQ
jgi:hypothetical protein